MTDKEEAKANYTPDPEVEAMKTKKLPVPIPGPDMASRVFLPMMGVAPPPGGGPGAGPYSEPAKSADEAFGGSGEENTAPIDVQATHDAVVEVIKEIYDPEIPVNIYELGLIYGIEVEPNGHVEIKMTLTAPACPVAGMLVEEVAQRSGDVEGVTKSHVQLVWDPPWTKERMSEDALLELGML